VSGSETAATSCAYHDSVVVGGSSSSSGAGNEDGVRVVVGVDRARGRKCARCWNYSEAVGSFAAEGHEELCERCFPVIQGMGFVKPAVAAAAPAAPVGAGSA
jgi:isoleucyl-tRNA synthetase